MRNSVNRQQLLGVVQTLDCRLSSVFGTEDRSSRNQHVGSGGDNLLDGLAVDSAVHFDMELRVELSASSRISATFGIISAMNDCPPNPGSTVMTSTRSISSM